MRVLITGGTGFLGRPLAAHLVALGYDCTVLTRDVARARASGLPREVKVAPSDTLPAADAVIHLAGESIAGLWMPRKKQRILASRVEGTRRLVAALREAKVKPHTLLAASAVGIYGDRPGVMLDETSPADPRGSFRAEVCREWEAAANAADALGIRVVNLRLGNVMAFDGGYLGGLLPLYRTVGGVCLGPAEAAIPWIAREDCVRLISFALANERWFGPLNLTAPAPVARGEWAASLARFFRRPMRGVVPASLVRRLLGEFSHALLDDQHVVPARAMAAGFAFAFPAWRDWLERAPAPAGRTDACQRAPLRGGFTPCKISEKSS